MAWYVIVMGHVYAFFLLFMAVTLYQGKWLRLDDSERPRWHRVIDRFVASVVALAATTAFGRQEGWVEWVQHAAVYLLFAYVGILGGIKTIQMMFVARKIHREWKQEMEKEKAIR